MAGWNGFDLIRIHQLPEARNRVSEGEDVEMVLQVFVIISMISLIIIAIIILANILALFLLLHRCCYQ